MSTPPNVRWWHSIRVRIAAAVTAVTLATIMPVGVFVDFWAAQQARERLRSTVIEQLNTASVTFIASRITTVGVTQNMTKAPAALQSVQFTAGMSATYFDGVDMWAVQALPNPETLITLQPDDPFGEQASDMVFLVLRTPAESLHQERKSLRAAMQWGAAPGVGFAAGLGWLTASGVSRRLRQSAAAARTLNVYQPAALPVGPVPDEVSALTQAVNDMTVRLADRADAEREFSALVAHELRTPTTALVSASELLPDDESGQVMRRGVHRLHTLIEDLLELFRTDNAPVEPVTGTYDLVALTTRIIAEHPKAAAVTLTGTQVPVLVRVDPRRFDRALTNVVSNAVQHGGGACTVTVTGPQVTVADNGPGFPDWLISTGPEPFKRTERSAGSGLGLAIAKRQVALSGGTIAFVNPVEGGAEVTLTFRV